MTPEILDEMTPEMLGKLGRYRAEMVRQEVPPAVVEQWTGAVLPCATLTLDGGGTPVVGRYGGPLLLRPMPGTPSTPSSPRYGSSGRTRAARRSSRM
ncbi:hypothetical protein ABZ456_00035 [Streptomyces sp. NPDC005776]|uniref:hypothetical protein n=1 Tax=Streptomyces sp. NPDC005776 TaxID=3154676 RepID=UPI0033D79835